MVEIPGMMRRHGLLLLLLLALALRVLAWPVGMDRARGAEGKFYDEYGGIAENLVQGEGFAYGWYGPVRPTSIHVPGYPLVLAVLFQLHDGEEGRALLTIAFNTLVSLALLLLGFRFADRTLGRGEAWLTGVALAFYPTQLHYAVSGIPTMLYAFMLLAVVASAWWLAIGPSLRRGAAWGLLLGLCALSYSFVVVVAPLLAAWVVVAARPGTRRLALLATVAAGLVALAVVSPWTVRNHAVHGELVLLRDQAGTNLWWGNSSLATGGITDRAGHRLGTMPDSVARRLAGMSEVEGDRYLGGLARAEMRQDPGRVAQLWVRKLGLFWWFGEAAGQDTAGQGRFLPVLKGLKALLLLLAAGGMARLVARRRWRLVGLVLVVAISLSGLHMVFHAGRMRYFFPLEPFLVLLAAHAVAPHLPWRRLFPEPA